MGGSAALSSGFLANTDKLRLMPPSLRTETINKFPEQNIAGGVRASYYRGQCVRNNKTYVKTKKPELK